MVVNVVSSVYIGDFGLEDEQRLRRPKKFEVTESIT